MRLFDEEPSRAVRGPADWQQHRAHRSPGQGPPPDEVGVLALSSFVLARTEEVAVAIRTITAFSDGLLLSVAVLFADEQASEDLSWSLQDYGRNPGRFRLGCAYADGRRATTGYSDAPAVHAGHDEDAHLVLVASTANPLIWTGQYWMWPLPPDGPLVVGCRWPDRRIAETLAQLEAAPLLAAAQTSRPVWEEEFPA